MSRHAPTFQLALLVENTVHARMALDGTRRTRQLGELLDFGLTRRPVRSPPVALPWQEPNQFGSSSRLSGATGTPDTRLLG